MKRERGHRSEAGRDGKRTRRVDVTRWMPSGILMLLTMTTWWLGEMWGNREATAVGSVIGALVVPREDDSDEMDVGWLVLRDGADRAEMWINGGEKLPGRIPGLIKRTATMTADGTFRTALLRIVTHEDATVIGVGATGVDSGVEIMEFGGLGETDERRLGELNLFRVNDGEEELEIAMRARGCRDIHMEVMQQYGGDVAQEWSKRRPEGLREWNAAREFRVDVRYVVAHEQLGGETSATTTDEVIPFAVNEHKIRGDGHESLCAKIEILRKHANAEVIIEGHTDERGDDIYNRWLGMARAVAVREFLVREGFEATRFRAVSYGAEVPCLAASTPEAWSRNRRVELQVKADSILSLGAC